MMKLEYVNWSVIQIGHLPAPAQHPGAPLPAPGFPPMKGSGIAEVSSQRAV